MEAPGGGEVLQHQELAANTTSDKTPSNTDQFYKTKLCIPFASGQCRRGRNCCFAHGTAELQKPLNLVKTKMCDAWANGACRRGNECTFAHGEDELRATADYYKTGLCKFWKRGLQCEAGAECRHAHGQLEIRERTYRRTERDKKENKLLGSSNHQWDSKSSQSKDPHSRDRNKSTRVSEAVAASSQPPQTIRGGEVFDSTGFGFPTTPTLANPSVSQSVNRNGPSSGFRNGQHASVRSRRSGRHNSNVSNTSDTVTTSFSSKEQWSPPPSHIENLEAVVDELLIGAPTNTFQQCHSVSSPALATEAMSRISSQRPLQQSSSPWLGSYTQRSLRESRESANNLSKNEITPQYRLASPPFNGQSPPSVTVDSLLSQEPLGALGCSAGSNNILMSGASGAGRGGETSGGIISGVSNVNCCESPALRPVMSQSPQTTATPSRKATLYIITERSAEFDPMRSDTIFIDGECIKCNIEEVQLLRTPLSTPGLYFKDQERPNQTLMLPRTSSNVSTNVMPGDDSYRLSEILKMLQP